MASDVLVARESFSTTINGTKYNIVKGKHRVRAGHPLAVQNPQFFEAVADEVDFDIEQATKAPGEKRGKKQATKAPESED